MSDCRHGDTLELIAGTLARIERLLDKMAADIAALNASAGTKT